MCQRSIIFQQGCEWNVNNRIFFFQIQIENLKLDFELSRIGAGNGHRFIGDRASVRPYVNAKNLLGGNVKSISAWAIIEKYVPPCSDTSLRRRASRMERREPRGGMGTFLAHGARRGMAKKRGDPVTSHDLRGGAASLSLGRRRSARSVHRARRFRSSPLLLIQLVVITTRFFVFNYVFVRKKNRGETKTNCSSFDSARRSASHFGHTYSNANGSDINEERLCDYAVTRIAKAVPDNPRVSLRIALGGEEFYIFSTSWLCHMTLWIWYWMD